MRLAKNGAKKAILDDDGIRDGVNTYKGKLTYKAVADNQNREFTAASALL